MALNGSGTISIGGSVAGQSINLELGRAAGAQSSLNESALRTLAGVSSGAISLSNFHGKSSFVVSLTTATVLAFAVSPSTATASISFSSNGGIVSTQSGPSSWGLPLTVGVGAGYWLQVDLISGTFTSSAGTGTPLQLNVSRVYSRNRSTLGTTNTVFRVRINNSSNMTSPLVDVQITLSATVES